eukprot:NODE_1412_length_604_cov_76.627859_g1399_i0.p1 GENE.NODE_1412_length_604_cov_76.627859_g1399_i0~~NODE_1412_length_604_cov_76.627859_g1399_i0.p1  ORF type:complete len:117 (-),score=16.52 NODE_1412_length_604_cov_76.627859_g1399_i0:102-452(-)
MQQELVRLQALLELKTKQAAKLPEISKRSKEVERKKGELEHQIQLGYEGKRKLQEEFRELDSRICEWKSSLEALAAELQDLESQRDACCAAADDLEKSKAAFTSVKQQLYPLSKQP